MSRAATLALAVGLVLTVLPAPAAQDAVEPDYPIDPALYQAMEWRNVGPHRGGRVTAVAGVADAPYLYYMGATGGGVWKTENAGATWVNISDGFFQDTQGAVHFLLSNDQGGS